MTFSNENGVRKKAPLTLLGSLGIVLVLGTATTGCGSLLPDLSSGEQDGAAVESVEDGAAEDGAGDTADEGAADGDAEGGAEDAGGQGGGGDGSSVRPGDLEYAFVSMTVDAGTITGASSDSHVPAGQYVLVEVEVENHGTEMITFSPVPLTLVDTQGAEYSHDIEATNAERDPLEFSHNIEPGDRGPVRVLFDIPVDAVPSHMIVADMGFGDPTANLSLD